MIGIFKAHITNGALLSIRTLAGILFVCVTTAAQAQKPAAIANKTNTSGARSNTVQTNEPAQHHTNGSLFSDDGRIVDLFSDFKPHRVGDLVFVSVVETSAASVSSSANTKRESGALGGAVVGSLPLSADVATNVANVIGALGSRKFDGSGTTGRKTTVSANIAARVVEVFPNGDLRIEAEKFVKINKEEERLTLSGVVRQRDVTPDNLIPTTSIADLRVALNGKGVASSNNGPGWLARFLEKISPF